MESLYLTVKTRDPDKRQQGTAWLLWPDLVVTALHVVGLPGSAGKWAYELLAGSEEPADAHELRLPDGATTPIEPLAYDPAADVALLRLPKEAAAKAPAGAFAVLAPERAIPGDPWRAKGYPEFEHGERALAVDGVVSFVGDGLANNTMQLFVDQGTSVQWGGISGSAAQNAWGEVIGVVVQTVAGIATCNAAPAEAAARLIQIVAQAGDLTARFEARLASLSEDDLYDVAEALKWVWMLDRPEYKAAPAAHLAKRIVQAGDVGMSLSLAALRGLGQGAGDAELSALVRDTVERRPSERDRLDVLAAIADEGGDGVTREALRDRLKGIPEAVLKEALAGAYSEGWLVRGPFSDNAPVSLSAEGARRIVRFDFERAALRALRDSGGATEVDLRGRLPIAPAELSRALVCAVTMGHAGRGPGDLYFIKPPGEELLDRRLLAPGGEPDRRETRA